MASAEVVSSGQEDTVSTASAPVYEYWWTLGHPGTAPQPPPAQGDIMAPPNRGDRKVWQDLQDIAARVYLYFPVSRGWRVREIIATVKYLTPVHQQQSWWAQAGADLKLLTPLVGDAGDIAGLIPGGATVSKWLETISKLQIASVPQNKEFPWTVDKVTNGGKGYEVMQGVGWNLPRSLLEAQGGRLTGSLAVSLISARAQTDEPDTKYEPEAGLLRAHAEIFPEGSARLWLPSSPSDQPQHYIDLKITPKVPPNKEKTPAKEKASAKGKESG